MQPMSKKAKHFHQTCLPLPGNDTTKIENVLQSTTSSGYCETNFAEISQKINIANLLCLNKMGDYIPEAEQGRWRVAAPHITARSLQPHAHCTVTRLSPVSRQISDRSLPPPSCRSSYRGASANRHHTRFSFFFPPPSLSGPVAHRLMSPHHSSPRREWFVAGHKKRSDLTI